MDATLAGLIGTTVGAVTGFAGAWLAQRAQIRLQREERMHQERVRWLVDKKPLFRDLLTALHGWHDSLVSVWREDAERDDLSEIRASATKWAVESSLIASKPVRVALDDVQRRFSDVQRLILERRVPAGSEPLADVLSSLAVLEDAMRAELAEPMRPPRPGRDGLLRRRAVG
ncbi:hypothetical protein [Streptomyces sp. NPDC001380]|uniref:hypothetical protein n=1 Tax=Streptomyces sp. NPDC001380 TaxID=3364566 RepID=UPI0036A672ED